MSDELIAQLGPLPRTHGLLDAMLSDPSPYRTDDITQDPRLPGLVAAGPPPDAVVPGRPHRVVRRRHRRLLPDRQGGCARLLRRGRGRRRAPGVPRRHRHRPGPAVRGQPRAGAGAGAGPAGPRAARRHEPVAVQPPAVGRHRPSGCWPRTRPGGGPRHRAGAGGPGVNRAADHGGGAAPADLERDGLAAALADQLTVAGRAHDVPVEVEIGELAGSIPTTSTRCCASPRRPSPTLRHAAPPGCGSRWGRAPRGPGRSGAAGERRRPGLRPPGPGAAGPPAGPHVHARAGRLAGRRPDRGLGAPARAPPVELRVPG